MTAEELDARRLERRARLCLGNVVPRELVLEAKKEDGAVWIRRDGRGAWTEGDECLDTDVGDGGAIRLGAGIDGRVRAFALFSAAKNDAFGGKFAQWAGKIL